VRPRPVVRYQAQAQAVQGAAGTHAVLTLAAAPCPRSAKSRGLEAFALGAPAVVLLDDERLAPASRVLIGERIAQARVPLHVLGVPPHRLGFVPVDGLASWLDDVARGTEVQAGDHAGARSTAASAATVATKRLAKIDAFGRLGSVEAAVAPSELPAGACFGEVVAEQARHAVLRVCQAVPDPSPLVR